MDLPECRETILSKEHDRQAFDCGQPLLNEYLSRFARQNSDAGVSRTFVIVPNDNPSHILGYYSLAAGQIEREAVPSQSGLRRMGRYPIPVIVLTRLAVDIHFQGLGLGSRLLLNAVEHALEVRKYIGVRALKIEAKDETAASWYKRFGAIQTIDAPLILILPLAKVAKAFP